MKKLLIILGVLFLLVGCGSSGNLSDDEVKDLFKTSLELEDINTNVDLAMDSNSDGMAAKINIKVRNIDDMNKAQAMMEMDAEELSMTYYLDQGYLYMDMFGMKVKSKVEDEDDFMEMFDVDEVVGSELDLDDIDFELFTIEQNKDTVSYSIKIDETMAAEFDGAIGSISIVINKNSKKIETLQMDVEVDGMSTKIDANYKANDSIEMPDFEGYSDVSDIE